MDSASDKPEVGTAAAEVASNHTPTADTEGTHFGARVKQILRKLGLAILLLAINVGYVALGGMVFSSLESPNEYSACNSSRELYQSNENATLELVRDIVSRLDGIATYTPRQLLSLEATFVSLLDRYGEAVVGNGYDASKDCDLLGTEVYPLKWSFTPAALFSMTIISTIGYGNIAPITPWGRFVCIPYAVLGISLYFFFLATFGPLVSAAFKGIYTVCCCCGCVRPRRRKKPSKRKLTQLAEDPLSKQPERPSQVKLKRGLITVSAAAESLDPEAAVASAMEGNTISVEIHRRPSAPRLKPPSSEGDSGDDCVGSCATAADSAGAGVGSPTQDSATASGRVPAGRTQSPSKLGVSQSGGGGEGHSLTPSSVSLPVDDSRALGDAAVMLDDDSRQEIDLEEGKAADKRALVGKENTDICDAANRNQIAGRMQRNDATIAPEVKVEDQGQDEKEADENEPEPSLPLFLCVGIFAGILVVSGEFFRQFEAWDLHESIYFSFVTLATIGFGDLVPGTRADLTASEVVTGSLSGMLFILVGMAFVSVLFDLMARAALANLEWLATKCHRKGSSSVDGSAPNL